MPHYLNPSVFLRYDFVITYLAVISFISWIRTIFQLRGLNYGFWMVWEGRNTLIHRGRRSQQVQESSNE